MKKAQINKQIERITHYDCIPRPLGFPQISNKCSFGYLLSITYRRRCCSLHHMAVTVPSTYEETYLKMFQVRHCHKQRGTEPYVRDAVHGSGHNGGSYSRCQLKQSNDILHLEVKSKRALTGREEIEISHGRGIQSSQETGTRLQFLFSPPRAKNTQGKKKGFKHSSSLYMQVYLEKSHKTRKKQKRRGQELFTLLFANCIVAKITVSDSVIIQNYKEEGTPISLFKEQMHGYIVQTPAYGKEIYRVYWKQTRRRPASRTHTALIITSILSQCFMGFLLPVDRGRGEADDP